MAARKRRGTTHEGWVEEVRDKIRTSMLVNRLIDHGLGKIDLSQTQLRAIEIAMRKTLPDLTESKNNTNVSGKLEIGWLPSAE